MLLVFALVLPGLLFAGALAFVFQWFVTDVKETK